MIRIELITLINAPVERCFDLSRSIDLHVESTKQTGERAIAGVTSGLIGLNETVTWRAKHFGIWQTLTSKITDYQFPVFFADEMVKGAFKAFRHEHHFEKDGQSTLMRDIFVYEVPLGWAGEFFSLLVLKSYMTKLLTQRNQVIKINAENV